MSITITQNEATAEAIAHRIEELLPTAKHFTPDYGIITTSWVERDEDRRLEVIFDITSDNYGESLISGAVVMDEDGVQVFHPAVLHDLMTEIVRQTVAHLDAWLAQDVPTGWRGEIVYGVNPVIHRPDHTTVHYELALKPLPY